jgi:glycosyltransferase involved in cell wall biosynthesis
MSSSFPSDAASPDTGPGDAVEGYICFSAQDWWYFNRGHSDFQLMLEVAARRPVLLVNSIGMRMPTRSRTTEPMARIKRKLHSVSRGLRTPVEDRPDFHVFTPVFLPIYGEGWLVALNRLVITLQVRAVQRWLRLGRCAVVVTLPTSWPVARRIRRACTIAYRSDRYSSLPEADGAMVASLERDLLSSADVACFASVALLAEESQLTRQPVLLSHGVDPERFLPAADLAMHPLLRSIPGPRVGYVGMIDDYTVDLELLGAVARALPSVQLVLAGPHDSDLRPLLALPNVHHIGVLPFEEVPAVLAGLDVALLPWQDNEWIKHCNPIKLKEYLAVGLATVSTDFPEVRRFADVVDIAPDPDGFVAMVADALVTGGRGDRQQRRAAAGAESWSNQAELLMALCEQTVRSELEKEELACAVS